MGNNIYDLNEYKKLLELQQQYENGVIDEDEMTLNQINNLIKLYLTQIKKIQKNVKIKLYQKTGDN